MTNHSSRLLSKSRFTRKKTTFLRFRPIKYRYSRLTKIPYTPLFCVVVFIMFFVLLAQALTYQTLSSDLS